MVDGDAVVCFSHGWLQKVQVVENSCVPFRGDTGKKKKKGWGVALIGFQADLKAEQCYTPTSGLVQHLWVLGALW